MISKLLPIISLLISLLSFSDAFAWETEELEINGPSLNRLDIAILGDGYREGEREQFRQNAIDLIDYTFSQTPFAEYREHYNFHLVYVISNESGADHPSLGEYRDTALDSTYDTYDIERLLSVDQDKTFEAAMDVDAAQFVFVLVNDETYGGSGTSQLAVTSIHEQSFEILTHEVGHMFAELADEYEDPYPGHPGGDFEPNVTFQSERERIPWNVWIEDDTPLPTPEQAAWADTIGLFEGARYLSEGIYRPRLQCRMRTLGRPYCEICAEALIRSNWARISPTDATGSTVDLAEGEHILLDAMPVQTTNDTVIVTWSIDGEMVHSSPEGVFDAVADELGEGVFEIVATLVDESPMLRIAGGRELATDSVTWTVNVGPVDGDTDGDEASDGDTPDGDASDGDIEDGDISDGDKSENDVFDDDSSDGDDIGNGDPDFPMVDGDYSDDRDEEATPSEGGSGFCQSGFASPGWVLSLLLMILIRRRWRKTLNP